jgi:hypothetical protein
LDTNNTVFKTFQLTAIDSSFYRSKVAGVSGHPTVNQYAALKSIEIYDFK